MIKWSDRSFAKTHGINADKASDELEEIRIRDGLIRPSAVVEAATPKSSELHKAFEWDNKKAAILYREVQARHVIKAVVIVDEQTKIEAPAYVNIIRATQDGCREQGYQRTDIAITRPDEWINALATFNSKISSARSSLDQLERMAAKSEQKDRLAAIAIAAKALDTAHAALTH